MTCLNCGQPIGDLRKKTCPYCGTTIHGTSRDIDSGIHHHMEYCDAAQAAHEEDTP